MYTVSKNVSNIPTLNLSIQLLTFMHLNHFSEKLWSVIWAPCKAGIILNRYKPKWGLTRQILVYVSNVFHKYFFLVFSELKHDDGQADITSV
jgi:hypothetical protein